MFEYKKGFIEALVAQYGGCGLPGWRPGFGSGLWPLSRMLFPLLSLWSAALSDPEVCYILDGILFLYGIILTALYCKIKVWTPHFDLCTTIVIQKGLTPHAADTYETIGTKK
uniref:Uncharacterized protein n=1 Tax=Labrus bergylta TaxID=56723 RepID=A0A3Q3E716_9LABR